MARLGLLLFIILSISSSDAAFAFDSLCEGVATSDAKVTAGFENFGEMPPLKKGETVGVITRYQISKKGGKAVFCSHSGGCVPAAALLVRRGP